MQILGIEVLGAAVVLSVLQTHAATADCSDATNTYNSAPGVRRAAMVTMIAHPNSVKLKNEQSDFESPVSEYESECN
jgi:hypothetical protein